MKREEARQVLLKIRALITGHPPGDPLERLEQIREIVAPQRKRMAKIGRDRQERGGFDRSE
jgi:hypothetical protein